MRGKDAVMTQQPEALRLADELDAAPWVLGYDKHAAELRRLHSVNAQLLEALEAIYTGYDKEGVWMIARDAIKAAKG
jgi:hypothetical protein